MVEFIRHLDKKYPHYLNTDFRANAIRESGSEMLDKGYVRSALSFDNGRRSGSVLTKEAEENMDADAISIFICCAERQDETRSSLTVFNTRRSAVSFLFRIFGRGGFPAGATVEIQNSFKGLKRVLVQEKAQSGTAKVQEGKEALKFGLYRYLNRKLLDSTERDAIFTHCYQTLSWNLMCHAGNTADIKYLHLRWDERSVRARDFSTKTGKNRFGEFRSLMRTIEQELKSKYGTEWRDPVTLEEVNRLYAEGCHVIEVPDVTPKNRRRRVNELSWNTVKKLHI